MKKLLLISIILFAGRVACGQMSAGPSISPTLPCRARTLDLRAYSATAGQTRTSLRTFSGVTCGTGWGQDGVSKQPKARVLSVQDQDSATCANRYWTGYELTANYQWQAAFDTLELFIDSCPHCHNPYSSLAFDDITSAFSHLSGSNSDASRASFLSWLESVLYLNTTDPEYFCSDVEDMAGVIPLPHDTTLGAPSRATNYTLAVVDWLLQNTTCDTPYLGQEYERSRGEQIRQWQENQPAYKLDTTLPPLDSIQPGLLALLDKHLLYATVSGTTPSILSNATASPNPVSTGTVITFGISQEAYVKINLFDLLGHEVTSPGYEGLFESGNHEVPLSLQSLPSGTYFARILTAYGNVATVKLVKE